MPTAPWPLYRLFLLALGGVLLAGCAGESAARLNQMQVIGTHNSFKRAIEPELYSRMLVFSKSVEGLDYSHLSLRDQLNLGVKNLEIDVYHDPDGGRYANPQGLKLLQAAGIAAQPFDEAGELARPGFKVLHDADFDFRSGHLAFEGALAELRAWSEAHPRHWPVVITMNCKSKKGDRPGSVTPGPFNGPVLDELDRVVLDGLGRERLLTPDDVRRGEATLDQAVRTRGWPALDACRGKFLFVLDEGGPVRDAYIAGHPSLSGRVYFVQAPPRTPEAAVFVINDPVKDEERIRSLVREGYLVRTRADADTREARAGSFTRFEAATRSGAQVITTDYAIPDRKINDWYVVRFDDGGFIRENPVVNAPLPRLPND